MSISFRCQNAECGKRLKAADERAGQRVRCPACGAPNVIPKAGGSTESGSTAVTPAGGERAGNAPAPREATPETSLHTATVTVTCPECWHPFEIDPDLLEDRVRCPAEACGALFNAADAIRDKPADQPGCTRVAWVGGGGMHYGLIVTPFDVLLVNGPFTTMSIVGMVVGALICPPLGLIVSLLFWFSLFTWFPARRRWKLFQAEDVEALRGQRSVLKFPLNECLLQFDDDTLKLTNKLSFKMPPATHSDCMSFVRQGQIFKERLPQGEASA